MGKTKHDTSFLTDLVLLRNDPALIKKVLPLAEAGNPHAQFLNIKIAQLQKSARKPLVLLATLPGEEHTLGLLMVFAMLSSHGISAVNLGGEVPMDQINLAVQQFRADVVGLTFSTAYHYKNIRPHLVELRGLISEDVEIWTGGEGVRRLRKLPEGVSKFNSLEKLPV